MNSRLREFESWRDSFLEIVQESDVASVLKKASITEDLMTWTSGLTGSVIGTCLKQGWVAAGKGHRLGRLPIAGQEFLGMDVMAFEAGASPRWPMPLAVFELENSPTDRRVAYSLWKVLCLRVPLRVVFAYRTDWERSRQLVESLTGDVIASFSLEQRTNIGGVTVLAVGNRGEGETFPWGYFKFWVLNPNLGRFEKI
jgi:hypothetical protein